MKKIIFWSCSIALSWLGLWFWYSASHPATHEIQDLPGDRPALLMKFQHGDPGNAQFLAAQLTYTARALDDPDLKKHEVCRGSIWSIHPQSCSMVADPITEYPAIYIDRNTGNVAMPFAPRLKRPGDYQLDTIALWDKHNGLATVSKEDASKVENKEKFLVRTFYVTRAGAAAKDTVALARHENPRWNVVIHAPPSYEIHADEVRVLPYFPTAKARQEDLSRGFRWRADGSDLPIAYLNQAGGVVDASTDESSVHEVRRSCSGHDSEAATKQFQRTAQFRQTTHLEYDNQAESGKRCRNILDRRGNRLVANALGDQLFVQETISHDGDKAKGNEYAEALWIKGKLAYAIVHDARKDEGEQMRGMLFIDDAFAKLYPDAAAELPMDRLATLKLRAESALAIALQ